MSSPKDLQSDQIAIPDNIGMDKTEVPVPASDSNKKSVIPPEGGTTGWLCIIEGSFGLFCTFGFLAAIGVFQTVYEENQLSTYSPSDISWIFTIQLGLMWLLGPIFGRFVDVYGPKPVIFLSQGLGFGLGAGGIFTTSFVVAGQWFVKQRGMALGIISAGSSLGGVIFPFFVNEVIHGVGFAGAMRYTALLIGILLALVCVLVTARLPRKEWNPDLRWFDFRLLLDKGFGLYTIGAFLVMWGLWAAFDYISSFALSAGFDPSLSIYLISIINAASAPGRIIPGIIADKLGYFNVMTVVSILTGLSVICLWIPFDNHNSLAGTIIFALAYGLFSGAYVSLMLPCAAKSGSLEALGQRFGTFQSIISIAALTGLPIQGAILNWNNGSYIGLQIFSAVTMVAGGLIIGAARMAVASSQNSAKV